MDNLNAILRKYALQNAVGFGGKADVKAVIGKALSSDPSLRSSVQEVSKLAASVVAEVNKLSGEKQRAELEQRAPELLERKKHAKRELLELKGAVKGKVVTRMAPEPSKHAHIGHALTFLINYLYAEKYSGKCILRLEDTNPELAKSEYAESIKEDIAFLGIKPSKAIIASNDMPRFYELAEKLVRDGNAYACFCTRERMRELRHKGLACECRTSDAKKNLEEWKNVIGKKYREGECVLRLKGDMESANHAMRDPVLFRLNYSEHFLHKNKYAAWPTYDFENAVEDGLCGVTHILRSIEFGEMRNELQSYLKNLLCLPQQIVVQYGRFAVAGALTQGREIRKLIDEGKFTGWDDPRLVTIKALRKRGIVPETFHELAIEVGLSKTSTTIDWSIIESINRKHLDPVCNRYFFVEKPKAITVKGAPIQHVSLKLHPDHPERGSRDMGTEEDFYISEKDFHELKDAKLYRLMDCLNFRKKGSGFVFDSKEHAAFREKGEKIIHWLPDSPGLIKTEVMMPDAKIIEGLAEPAIRKVKENDIVQFVRFGFCRLEKAEKDKLFFWYCHQ